VRVHHKAGHNGQTGVPAVQLVVRIQQECVDVSAWVALMPKQCVQVFLLNIKHVRYQHAHNGSNGDNGTLALFHVVMEHVDDNVNVPNLEKISVLDRPHRPKSVRQDLVVVDGISGRNGVNVQFLVVVVSKHDQESVREDKSEEEIVSVMPKRKRNVMMECVEQFVRQ